MTKKNQEKRKVFAIRLSPTERQTIESKSYTAGMKLGEYIRANSIKTKNSSLSTQDKSRNIYRANQNRQQYKSDSQSS